jgi:hypothetical protein
MKLILFLEKIMPFKDSTIINIYSFLNKLIFVIVNIVAPIHIILGLIGTLNGSLVFEPLLFLGIIILVLLVNISYRFNKILLNKLR